MRFAVAGALALAMCGGALSGSASAQEAQLGWVKIGVPAGAAAGWAVKPASGPSGHPQLLIVMRVAKPGATPGTDVRASEITAFDLDCPAGKERFAGITRHGADFAQTGSEPGEAEWGTFAEFGDYGRVAAFACANPNRATEWQADIKGTQQRLDASLPKPKAPTTPPATSRFEYLGDGGSSYQSVDHWLDTASITREGNIAKVWLAEIWTNSLLQKTTSYPPVTWRLYEVECAKMQRYRNVFWQQLAGDLTYPSNTESEDAKFSTGGDPNKDAMMKRVCDNRPLLFSKTIEGDLKTLLSRSYAGMSQKLGTNIAMDSAPRVQPVDLGPSIRIEEGDANWKYSGTFTRSSSSDVYVGMMQTEGITNPNRAVFEVRGIIDGKLVLIRSGTPGGEMRISVANGKVSGKGISSWERADDTYSWKLVEPTSITMK